MRQSRLWAAAVAVCLSAAHAGASPLNWPDEGEAMALHCAAVLSAYGHAYEFANDLAQVEALPFGGPPATLVQEAGGDASLSAIEELAAGYFSHAESVARTNFYPRLVGDGTPYLADDGRELVMAVQSCVDRYAL
ncbi:hypothetical protein [Gymnodinialimonas hymeniacidonis]|uniref:hypothetical protein n=1 Tax=Gymnodinialimonas hymeniacidonis TaxID=3126508 RepID=UPI0034C631A7